ncbi:early nodulin-like protein 1 [Mangifera indica]|uniref:early nodulin-like protein 1 n=1 Tax=Mangifera indica TaxID=29780 RepID=UPI001CFA5B2D|nr:early nodulin-like protein 1 [Mangifera indica]
MQMPSFLLIFFLSLLSLFSQPSHSTTILVDGVSEWKNPTVHVGDSIIFKSKYNYSLYIFKNKDAFNLCNFTQATLLTRKNSTSYTWHPSRSGFFYFTFNNGLLKTCQDAQKLSIEVLLSHDASIISPQHPPMEAPAPVSGGGISSSPAYPWPFRPRQEGASPGPAPVSGEATSPVTMPSLGPDKGGGMPFINSNPAVPLPTGEVDSATIRPLPTSGQSRQVVVGFVAGQMVIFSAVFLLL